MSRTSHHSRTLDDERPSKGAEQAAESSELTRRMLGIIDAYRMGAALDAKDLYRSDRRSAPPHEPAPAT